MNKTFVRATFALLTVACVLSHFLATAHASSLGIGTNEAVLPSTGWFGSLMNWVNVHQQQFYRSLTGALKTMRDDGTGAWALVGLSFVYGIFHAAGPGHGKAVISSYMLANEVALRRGVVLSFVSAFLQALSAILMITAVFLLLRGTSVSMTDATWFLEVASYVLVTLFGAWLLWKKAWPRLAGIFGRAPASSLSAAFAGTHIHDENCGHQHVRLGGATTAQSSFVCETCGHSHAPDPAMLSGDRFDWRTAWSAVIAVGLRPCSGALIVLTFAFLNGLWMGGILSVLAMAFGTGITVAVLATLAVTAKNWAVAFAGDGRTGNVIHATVEIGGAALVFGMGLLLLSASLSA